MPESTRVDSPITVGWITTQITAQMRCVQDLLTAVRCIRSGRRTGKLTLNFAQGAIVSGEWTEKTKP